MPSVPTSYDPLVGRKTLVDGQLNSNPPPLHHQISYAHQFWESTDLAHHHNFSVFGEWDHPSPTCFHFRIFALPVSRGLLFALVKLLLTCSTSSRAFLSLTLIPRRTNINLPFTLIQRLPPLDIILLLPPVTPTNLGILVPFLLASFLLTIFFYLLFKITFYKFRNQDSKCFLFVNIFSILMKPQWTG
jgi:hypothetical protein